MATKNERAGKIERISHIIRIVAAIATSTFLQILPHFAQQAFGNASQHVLLLVVQCVVVRIEAAAIIVPEVDQEAIWATPRPPLQLLVLVTLLDALNKIKNKFKKKRKKEKKNIFGTLGKQPRVALVGFTRLKLGSQI